MAKKLDSNLNNDGKLVHAVGEYLSNRSVAFDSAREGGMVFALL